MSMMPTSGFHFASRIGLPEASGREEITRGTQLGLETVRPLEYADGTADESRAHFTTGRREIRTVRLVRVDRFGVGIPRHHSGACDREGHKHPAMERLSYF